MEIAKCLVDACLCCEDEGCRLISNDLHWRRLTNCEKLQVSQAIDYVPLRLRVKCEDVVKDPDGLAARRKLQYASQDRDDAGWRSTAIG